MKRSIAGLACAMFAAACVSRVFAQGSPNAVGSLDVAGVKRTYVVHVPAKLAGAVPLVLSFHGHGGDGAGQARLTHLDALSDARGFIVVYPDGINRSWNDGRPQNAGSDDIALVTALIADFERRYPIDRKRIYVTGFSNGGTFTQYVGCKLADRIAAIAPVSGSLPEEDAGNCHPARAISVFEIAGTSDPIMPYDGGKIGFTDRGSVVSVEKTTTFWRSNAGCGATPQTSVLSAIAAPDGTSVKQSTYACPDGASVVLDTVAGGGHTWPGGPQYAPRAFIGVASDQLDASQAIVDFFYAHSLP